MIFKRFNLDLITWQALAVTSGGASTLKAGLSAAPTYKYLGKKTSNSTNNYLQSFYVSIVQLI